MRNKKRIIYLSSIVAFAVLLHLFFSWSYPYLYSDALCNFFSPFKEHRSDNYILVFYNIVATGAALLFAKLVLKKLHNNRMDGIGSGICTDLVITHLAVCLFTVATFWMKIEWQYISVLQYLFSGLLFICLLIYHRNHFSKAVATHEKRSFAKARLLLNGVLIAIPIIVAVFQVYVLIFSLNDYEYIPASPVAMFLVPVKLFLQPLVAYIFNPEFFSVSQWQNLCTDIFPYCLLAVLAGCSTENLFLRKNN